MLQCLVFAAIVVYTQAKCPPNVCDSLDCPDVSACNGTLTKVACGCCSICVTVPGRCAPWHQEETNDRIFVPTCIGQGHYDTVQCDESICFCTNLNGEDIEKYTQNIQDAKDMNCQCARDKHEYQQFGGTGQVFNCAPNGNYAIV